MIPPKHTPGPWVVKSTDEDINTKTIIDSNEFWIAKVLNFNRASDDIRESQANANLIAAAPAMHEALQALLALIGDEDLPDNGELSGASICDFARSALAQAEGRHHE